MLKEVNWDKFEFRCHYFGELMTKTRGKSNLEKYNEAQAKYDAYVDKLFSYEKNPTSDQCVRMNQLEKEANYLKQFKDIVRLSDTCKKRLAQIYTEETTGRKKNFESLYMEKGVKTEEKSITNYSLLTGTMYRKNKERINNGYVSGELDFDDPEQDMTIDAKGSWDLFTFDATVAKAMGNNYWWQGQMYMWLKNRKRHRVFYSLVNTPTEILNKLENRLFHSFIGTSEDYQEALKELRRNHIFDDLPLERKGRVYTFERDDDAIDQAKVMIPQFRNYLSNFGKNTFVYEQDSQ